MLEAELGDNSYKFLTRHFSETFRKMAFYYGKDYSDGFL